MLFGGMFRNELNIKPVTHFKKDDTNGQDCNTRMYEPN